MGADSILMMQMSFFNECFCFFAVINYVNKALLKLIGIIFAFL